MTGIRERLLCYRERQGQKDLSDQPTTKSSIVRPSTMSAFHNDALITNSSFFPAFGGSQRFEMWQDQTVVAAITSHLVDNAWDIAALEARIGASWAERNRVEPSRIQDLALEITDHQPNEHEDSGWPFHQSPCRLFGSRRRKRNSTGELRTHRSCSSLTQSAEFGVAVVDHVRQTNVHDSNHRNIVSMGRHRSFDEFESASTRMRQPMRQPTVVDRPGIHRAMSIEEVELPDQTSTATKRRRGRRPVLPSAGETAAARSPQRDLLKLLREKQQVTEQDLCSKENRKILHCIVYQQKMNVCFRDLVSHVHEDIENDPDEAFLRPPIPMFLDE